MKRVLFCLVILFFLGACKSNYSRYREPKKAKHHYTGKKNKDLWMDLKRGDILGK